MNRISIAGSVSSRFLTGLAAVVLLLASAAGCGGDGDGEGEGSDHPEAGAGTVAATETGPGRAGSAAGESAAGGAKAGDETVAGDGPAASVRDPKTRRRIAINTLAGQNVLKLLGLEGTVTISADGHRALVTLFTSTVCRAVPADEGRIDTLLRQAEPSIKQVTVIVEGGSRLAPYLAANCSASQIPSGPGPIVFEQSGQGSVETRTFQIRSSRWAIEYRNEGQSLFVFVKRGEQFQPQAISQQSRGVGRQVFEGPGRFSLRIQGSGYWTVRARDGA